MASRLMVYVLVFVAALTVAKMAAAETYRWSAAAI